MSQLANWKITIRKCSQSSKQWLPVPNRLNYPPVNSQIVLKNPSLIEVDHLRLGKDMDFPHLCFFLSLLKDTGGFSSAVIHSRRKDLEFLSQVQIEPANLELQQIPSSNKDNHLGMVWIKTC